MLRRSGVPGRGASVTAAAHPEPAWQQQRAVRKPNEFSVARGGVVRDVAASHDSGTVAPMSGRLRRA